MLVAIEWVNTLNFYWPTMTVDAAEHIKSCDICQRVDKILPRKMIMQKREWVTVPSERLAVDIVGVFPVAKGGWKYLLTYIDLATRWPEGITLRRTMTASRTAADRDLCQKWLPNNLCDR